MPIKVFVDRLPSASGKYQRGNGRRQGLHGGAKQGTTPALSPRRYRLMGIEITVVSSAGSTAEPLRNGAPCRLPRTCDPPRDPGLETPARQIVIRHKFPFLTSAIKRRAFNLVCQGI